MFPSRCVFLCAMTCSVWGKKILSTTDTGTLKIFHLDDYEDCLAQNGFYCTVAVQLAAESRNASKEWIQIQESNKDSYRFRKDWLRHGLCLHQTCPEIPDNIYRKGFNNTALQVALSKCYTRKFKNYRITAIVVSSFCESNEPYFEVDIFDRMFSMYILVVITMTIMASFYEGLARYKPKKDYEKITGSKGIYDELIANIGDKLILVGKIMKCFSIPENWNRLCKENTSDDGKQLSHIQAVRTLNTMIVVFAHVVMCIGRMYTLNPEVIEDAPRQPENTLMANGSHAVMTFLLISAFLFSYNFMLLFDAPGKRFQFKDFFLAILNRCLRLYPVLFTVLAFNATWSVHLGRGPQWNRMMHHEHLNCRANWWTNMLFVNNFVNKEHMCLQQTWYLAVDSQLFVYGLVIMPIVLKYKNHAMKILTAVIVVSVAVSFAIFYYYDFFEIVKPEAEAVYGTFLHVPEWHFLTSHPISNVGSYNFGLLYGYLHYKYLRFNQYKWTENTLVLIIWWILILAGPLASIYIGYFFIQPEYEHSRLMAAFNLSCAKTIFGACIGLLMLGVNQGMGWFVKFVLKWKPIEFLGRLTFCVYLIHAMAIRLKFGSVKNLFYTSNFIMFGEAMSAIVVSFILSLFLCLLVELPATALQKLLTASSTSNAKALEKHKKVEQHEKSS